MLFINNKYTKWYFNIIANAGQYSSDYYEQHHIIPKSLGGNNTDNNLVKLSAREHFICHWLLTKMVNNTKHQYQMWNAFSCMLYRENPYQQRHKISSRIFENIKKANRHIKSKKMLGENNPMFNKTHTAEARKKISEAHKGKKHSAASRKRMSEVHKGKPKSEEHKIALKEAWQKTRNKRSGKNAVFYGCNHSEETKEKIRQKVKNMPKEKCIHCGLETTKGNINRWHNDRCKFK